MTMTRFVSPPKSEHSKLRQSMTNGEQILFDLFDSALDVDWEIYIQPHLNGLRPDFVLLNPAVGICVVEVKDWNLDAMRYFVKEQRSGSFELYAENQNGEFRVDNPFNKIRRYKDAIFNTYCPRLQNKFGYAAIVGSVVFPFAHRSRVLSLQERFLKSDSEIQQVHEYWPVAGQEELTEEGLPVILPILRRENHRLMTESLADDLRGWLVEPDFAKTQRVGR